MDSRYLSKLRWSRVLIEPSDNPLFKKITVRPEFDIGRVRSVILHIPAEQSGAGAGAGAGAPGGGAP